MRMLFLYLCSIGGRIENRRKHNKPKNEHYEKDDVSTRSCQPGCGSESARA